MGTLHENLCTFMIISRSIFPSVRYISEKYSRENQNTHFMLDKFFSKNLAVYEIMWKNMVEPDSPQMTK
jgi:hypothetical protein